MKKIISLTIILFLTSCNEKEKSKPIKINTLPLNVYTFEGCEYIGKLDIGFQNGNFLTHKGNCKKCTTN